MYQITYTSRITGERLSYMNIGFETRELAQAELNRIKREQKKNKTPLNSLEGMIYYPSFIVGKNFRIKKIKVRMLSPRHQ